MTIRSPHLRMILPVTFAAAGFLAVAADARAVQQRRTRVALANKVMAEAICQDGSSVRFRTRSKVLFSLRNGDYFALETGKVVVQLSDPKSGADVSVRFTPRLNGDSLPRPLESKAKTIPPCPWLLPDILF